MSLLAREWFPFIFGHFFSLNNYSYPFPSLIVFCTLMLLGWQCAPENGFPLSVFFGRALQTFPNWNKGNKGAGKYLDN